MNTEEHVLKEISRLLREYDNEHLAKDRVFSADIKFQKRKYFFDGVGFIREN